MRAEFRNFEYGGLLLEVAVALIRDLPLFMAGMGPSDRWGAPTFSKNWGPRSAKYEIWGSQFFSKEN